jgi:transposase
MKPYSLDMRQNIVNTYEAGNTSVRKVAERFQGAQKYGTGTTQTKKRDREITPLSGKRGETKPTLWSGRTDQRDGSRTSRLHMLQNTVSIGKTKQE